MISAIRFTSFIIFKRTDIIIHYPSKYSRQFYFLAYIELVCIFYIINRNYFI